MEGKKLYVQGDLEGSLALLEAVYRQEPRFAQNACLLGRACYFRGDTARAEEVWRAILARNPEHIDAGKWLARLRLQQGQPEAAAALVAGALAGDAEDPELLILLARAEAADGNYGAAIQLYQRVQLFEQRLAEARIDLAEIYQRFGLAGKALPELEQAARLVGRDSPLQSALQSLMENLRGGEP